VPPFDFTVGGPATSVAFPHATEVAAESARQRPAP